MYVLFDQSMAKDRDHTTTLEELSNLQVAFGLILSMVKDIIIFARVKKNRFWIND
jgi:hypothetical protein